jgi:hypothetical protein
MKGKVTIIRVDIPSTSAQFKGSFTYFFISAEDGRKWDPWWDGLFGFLLNLERQPAGLSPDGVEMEVSLMAGETRQDFLRLLRTAPPSVVEGHRTLRSALRRLPQQDLDVPVRFFGPVPESREVD